MTLSRIAGLSISIMTALILSQCSTHYWVPRVPERPIAEGGVGLFHQRLSDRQFDQISRSIAASKRTIAKMITFMRKFREDNGTFVSSEEKVAVCAPNALILVYRTRYSNGNVVEIFTWAPGRRKDPLLMGYQVGAGDQEIPKDWDYMCPERESG
jgi:hypothetical protein